MNYSTEELYDKWISGQSIEEISNQTGLNKWALYKRFQRLEKTRQVDTQNDDSNSNESEQTVTLENITPVQKQNTNWTEITLALMSLAIVFISVFLYREHSKDDNQIDDERYDDYS